MAGYVELFRLGKSYATARGPAVIVHDFSLNIEQGEFVALLGHSGCGKSTVLSMIAGLNSITAGSIVVANREIDGPGPDRGVVFQSPCLLPWMTALDNVMLGVNRVYPQLSSRERLEIGRYYLDLVGLGNDLYRRASDLSQGMQQRVGIARAFAISPKMLLLDEPFGMLDSLTRMDLQEALLDLLALDQKTTLMVTHDVDEALFMADRIVMMTSGPAATVGEILPVPFPRPRIRQRVLAHPAYYDVREQMIRFLEEQDRAEQEDVPLPALGAGEETSSDSASTAPTPSGAGDASGPVAATSLQLS
ncbi:MAG TPA: nitrate ABC transporter ATP-binding protein [Pirellulaceae bacterium]|nr:nitrate ABC transporter ATP-binding protein [Pirellulaceae bacterium]